MRRIIRLCYPLGLFVPYFQAIPFRLYLGAYGTLLFVMWVSGLVYVYRKGTRRRLAALVGRGHRDPNEEEEEEGVRWGGGGHTTMEGNQITAANRRAQESSSSSPPRPPRSATCYTLTRSTRSTRARPER